MIAFSRSRKKNVPIRKILGYCIILCLGLISVIAYCHFSIQQSTRLYTYHTVSEIPYRTTALLLGTSPKLENRADNPYFLYRIQAAAELYKAGKIKYLLLSGDNSRHNYNEPESMKQALLRQGIPETVIYLDYAGFRTLDSVIRAKEIFGQDALTIISQQFHNERAIYLAQAQGIDAIGYNAPDVPIRQGIKTRLREYLARIKVFIDIWTNRQPHFKGEKINLPTPQ